VSGAATSWRDAGISSAGDAGEREGQHERGHAVQSRRLGPMYLPLVGLASVTRVGFAAAHKALTGRRWAGYYDGWPEREADLLGGVDRALRPAP
jgi:hypothetical protein